MAEPHSTVLAGALIGAGVSSATLFIGAQVDALVVGLIAAVFVSFWLETINSRSRAAAAVMFAAMLAGYGSPVVAGLLAAKVPEVTPNLDALRLLLAALIGGGSPSLVPLSLKALGRRIEAEVKP